jgi:hypothetical protein
VSPTRIAAVVLALTLGVPACSSSDEGGNGARFAAAVGATTSTSTTTTTAAPARPTFEPVRIRMPAVQVDAPIVPLGIIPNGELDVPPDPKIVGWWRDGNRPGGATGGVVLDGHVDSARLGLGVFARLRNLSIGDVVEVSGADGATLRYVVTTREEHLKTALPAREVFSQDVPERLVLITCGGDFDRATRHYEKNVVGYADPLD